MRILLIIAALLSAYAASAQVPAREDSVPYGNNPQAGHYLDTRGFKLYYETYGQGEPLLIIHGNGGSIDNFVYQIPFFARSYHVIIADSRAQGKSVDPSDTLSYEMITDDLNALLESLHLDSCYVIGWSDGGIEGLMMAIRHPEKVRKLAVTGANLWPDTTAVQPWVVGWALNYNAFVKKTLDTVQNPSKRAQAKNTLKLAHLLSYEPHISLEQLHTIQCPVLVIGGDHDVIRPAHTLLIFQNIRKADLWILPNSGHSTPIFYKDDFNRVVGDFFKKPYRTISTFGMFQ
jgi:pimeloyl-ACP methyl ester carboxylesterase